MNKTTAIVYTSNTGFTKRYAKMLGEKLSLDTYNLADIKKLPKRTPIIYMGWLCAGNVKGYKKAARRFNVSAVIGVALGDTGSQVDTARRAIKLADDIPLFTVQGGMDCSRLRGINKFMIDMLIKMLSSKQDATDDEKRMLKMIKAGGDFVSEKNLSCVIAWYNNT